MPQATVRHWLSQVHLCLGESNAPVSGPPLQLVEACNRVADLAVHSDQHASCGIEVCDIAWEKASDALDCIESSAVSLRDDPGGIIFLKNPRRKYIKGARRVVVYRLTKFCLRGRELVGFVSTPTHAGAVGICDG